MGSQKRILIVGSYAPSLLHFRGALIAAILADGHVAAAAAPNMSAEVADKLRAMGAEPEEVSLSNASLSPHGLVKSLGAVRELIRRTKPDVILAYTIKPVILCAIAGRASGVPVVSLITGAGYAFTGGMELKRLVSRTVASRLYRIALKRSDVIVFQNRDDEKLFRDLRLVERGRETHIVNGSGIDLGHFSPVPLPDKPAFLMIARLLKDKGIREFAEAAKRLKAEHPDVDIALVGFRDPSPDSLPQADLDELIRCGIDFKGHLADVRPAIAQCSVYVLPSYREGTPRSVLEAMAMGRAIVTTDVPGCRETVRDGETGFLVEARSATALHEAMERFVSDPSLAVRMGAASRRYAEEKYDVRDVNAELMRLMGLPDFEEGRGVKRLIDFTASLAALVILSPVIAVLAVLVRVKLGSPVFFRQKRPGLHGKPFTLIKFRTMRDAFDPAGKALPDEERMTAFGDWLRRSSLDELPEFWNVVRGDMSLVGPRPLMMQYLPRYTAEQMRRHDVRPGLTGWAQVNGRNAVAWDEKFRLDVWYVDNRSLLLDFRILWMTVRSVLRSDGISAEGSATMPEFMGTEGAKKAPETKPL